MRKDRHENSETAGSAKKQSERIEKDATGQFVGTQHGGDNDGVVSAKPTVITGSQDATTHKRPANGKNPPEDWNVNFDLRDKDKA